MCGLVLMSTSKFAKTKTLVLREGLESTSNDTNTTLGHNLLGKNMSAHYHLLSMLMGITGREGL